jgi:hypothetical protein
VRALSLVRVLVPADRAADARRILAEGEPLPEDAEAPEETGSEREVP